MRYIKHRYQSLALQALNLELRDGGDGAFIDHILAKWLQLPYCN